MNDKTYEINGEHMTDKQIDKVLLDDIGALMSYIATMNVEEDAEQFEKFRKKFLDILLEMHLFNIATTFIRERNPDLMQKAGDDTLRDCESLNFSRNFLMAMVASIHIPLSWNLPWIPKMVFVNNQQKMAMDYVKRRDPKLYNEAMNHAVANHNLKCVTGLTPNNIPKEPTPKTYKRRK